MFALDAAAYAAVTQTLKENGAHETPGAAQEGFGALARPVHWQECGPFALEST